MNSRLIPWFLAATGFVAVLAMTWEGRSADPLRSPVQPYAARPGAAAAVALRGIQQAAGPSSEDPEDQVATAQVLPLPSPGEPDPHPAVQPVPDDAPAVEDLPAPHAPPDSIPGP